MNQQEYTAWLDDDNAQRVVLYHINALNGDTPITLKLASHSFGGVGVPYLPIIAQGLVYTEAITEDGNARVSASEITAWNLNHEYDGWLDYVFSGQDGFVYLVDARWTEIPAAALQFKLVLDDIDPAGSSEEEGATLTFKMRDVLDRMNAPITELTMPDGSLWPLTFGEVCNITPKVKNATTNEQTYHPTATEGLIAARIEGKKRATTITEDKAHGAFTVSSNIVGALTASVQGDKLDGIYRNTVAALVRHIVKNYGPASTRFTEAEIDGASFDAFEIANRHAVGLHLTERTLVVEAVAKLASSLRAQMVPSPVGKLRLIQYAVPSTATAEIRQKHYALKENVSVIKRHEVKGAVSVGYCKNYTPQPNIQTTLSPEFKAMLAQQWREARAINQPVVDKRKQTTAAKMRETCLLNLADAQREANAERDQVSIQRTTYAVEGMAPLLALALGQGVTLYGDYYGLQAGKVGQIVLRTIDLNTITIHTEVRV